jgi:hypothetical protein
MAPIGAPHLHPEAHGLRVLMEKRRRQRGAGSRVGHDAGHFLRGCGLDAVTGVGVPVPVAGVFAGATCLGFFDSLLPLLILIS